MEVKARFQILSARDFDPKARGYKKRRVYEKTRTGCLTCKTKKVKCDEAKPVCIRCRRNSRSCTYGPPSSDRQESDQSSLGILDPRRVRGLSVLSAVTVFPFSSPSARNGTPSMYLMQHFHQHWDEIFPMPRGDAIMALITSHPLVRNTVLAITACHLRHVCPGLVQHRIAEHFQQSLAIRDCRKLLTTPREVLGQPGVDVLLLGAALLNILAFALPEFEFAGGDGNEPLDPTASWVFSPRDDRLGWLALQAGLRLVLKSMEGYLAKTLDFLAAVFLGDANESWAFTRVSRGLDGVPERWIRVFELEDGGASGCDCEPASSAAVAGPRPADVFRSPVIILAHLRHLEPVRRNVFQNLQFQGKMHPEFRALLCLRDERAFWLLGYWLGLMCRYNGVWWCERRAKRGHRAIRMWLTQLRLTERPGVEGEMWKEMMEEFDLAPVFVRY